MLHALHGECNNYILYAIWSCPMWQEKSFRTPDPLSAFWEGSGHETSLVNYVHFLYKSKIFLSQLRCLYPLWAGLVQNVLNVTRWHPKYLTYFINWLTAHKRVSLSGFPTILIENGLQEILQLTECMCTRDQWCVRSEERECPHRQTRGSRETGTPVS